jgi:hypothetical protein
MPAPVAAALRAHKTARTTERLACRYWRESGLVFTTTVGTPLEAANLRRGFRALTRRAKVGDRHPTPHGPRPSRPAHCTASVHLFALQLTRLGGHWSTQPGERQSLLLRRDLASVQRAPVADERPMRLAGQSPSFDVHRHRDSQPPHADVTTLFGPGPVVMLLSDDGDAKSDR